MAFNKLWTIAYRSLGRNRRRTALTMLVVVIGLALIILINGMIAGVFDSAIASSILLETGHLQIRAESYDARKASLEWQDLLDNSEGLLASVTQLEGIAAVAPELRAHGLLNTVDDSFGVRVIGIDPASTFHDPIRQGVIAGEYLAADDREGILIGRKLASELRLDPGAKVSLLVGTSDGNLDEDIFTVRGIFSTGLVAYDSGTVYMPLSKAQAITNVGDRVSAVIVLTDDTETAAPVAAALAGPGRSVVTWQEMNELVLIAVEQGNAAYTLIYGIVIAIVAVIIVNTLLMGVFERTRELGILAALGMKGRQIMAMILLEAGTLALLGTILGVLLGALGVWYMSFNGITLGDDIAGMAEGFAYPSVIYTKFSPGGVIGLSSAMIGIILLSALYPARLAAKLEPVEALHAL